MRDRSGLATATFGFTYWRERAGAKLAALRLAQTPRCDVARIDSGLVHVRGAVRAIEPTTASALSGRPAVFGRVLACLELRRRVQYGESFLPTEPRERVVHADVVYGGSFAIEDATGRVPIHLGADDPFELLVSARRLFHSQGGPQLDRLRRFAATPEGAGLAPDDERMVHGEWVIEDGQELSVIATVRAEEVSPDDRDYRGLRRAHALVSRDDRPICFFV